MIRRQWQDLIKPIRLNVDSASDERSRVASIIAEPLEKGFGHTLGNSLRRILLSSLKGAAVTSIKIDGVLHEFSSIDGVKEDVTNVVLNLKSLALKMETDSPRRMSIAIIGPCEVRAGMFEKSGDIEIMDPEHYICTIEDGHRFVMEMIVSSGRGYNVAVQNQVENAPIGTIFIDSLFSPVRRVAYKIENTRVGQDTDFDKLILDVETDGSISPEDAVGVAAKILQDQLNKFIKFDHNFEEEEEGEEAKLPFNHNLLCRIEDLEFSVRSLNCLRGDNILYIGDLVQKTENEMLKTPNFGKKSLNEIKEILTRMGLTLGMAVVGWPPENIEELAKKIHEKF